MDYPKFNVPDFNSTAATQIQTCRMLHANAYVKD